MEGLSHPERDMRRFRRRPYTEAIDFSVVMPELREREAARGLKGTIVDVSDGGVRIHAEYPFEPGVMLSFTDSDGSKNAIVKWAMKVDDKFHKAGLAFHTDDTYGRQYPVELRDACSEIREGFGEVTAVLDAKTEEYIEALEALAAVCSAPGVDRGKIMNSVRVLNDEMMAACAEFEKAAACDSDFIQSRRRIFQEKTDRILSRSYLLRHARTWPQGCQGDYKILEHVYKNTPLSEGIGYFLDRYALSLSLAEAVRGRIVKLEDIIRKEIRQRETANTDPLSVLNIACGSCRELMGLSPDIARASANVTCIDTDADALAFAMERLTFTEASENIMFRKYNATRMFDDDLNMAAFGKTDIIYSAGLFDYLPSEFLAKLLGALYRLLNKGGVLVAPFKDAERYSSQVLHWIVNWTGFLQRTTREFRAILDNAGIPQSAIREERDGAGIIIFYLITKE